MTSTTTTTTSTGVSNAFLVAQQHPLATTYNDVSVLENMHASTLFQVRSSALVLAVLEAVPRVLS
jgi:hypothetical protein